MYEKEAKDLIPDAQQWKLTDSLQELTGAYRMPLSVEGCSMGLDAIGQFREGLKE